MVAVHHFLPVASLLCMTACCSWLIGTVTASGGSMIFLLFTSLFLPITAVPILVSFVGTVTAVYRIFLFRGSVYWPILVWQLPATILGSALGAGLFSLLMTQQEIGFLHFLLSFVLVLGGIIGFPASDILKFKVRPWFFMPCGFVFALLSGVIGGSAALTNLLYQRMPLDPYQVIGTKSWNMLTSQLSKSLVYVFLIFLNYRGANHAIRGVTSLKVFLLLAAIAGGGAIVGTLLGKRLLSRIDYALFRRAMNVMLIVFGLYFLYLGLVH